MLEKQIIEDKIKEIRLDRIRFRSKRRLLLDLKDKIVKDSGEAPFLNHASYNTIRDEALSALVALGFSRVLVRFLLLF